MSGKKRKKAEQASKKAENEVKTEEKPVKSPSFEFKWSNPKFRALIPFAIFVLVFLWIWTEPAEKPTDPWFEAAFLVDSSRKVQDPKLKSEMLEKGGDQLRDLVNRYPKHARVKFLLGYYYSNAGKLDSAIDLYTDAIRMDSGATINPVAPMAAQQVGMIYSQKSNMLLNQGKIEEAKKAIQPGLKYARYSPVISTQMGVVFHREGQIDSAITYYTMALNINGNHKPALQNLALAFYQKGNVLLKNKNLTQALEYFNRSAKMNFQNADLYNNMGYVLNQLGQAEQSVNAYKKALQLKPGHVNAIRNLAAYYQKTGNMAEAKKYMQMLGGK